MARKIITTQTLFFLLILIVLTLFFYNVVNFSRELLRNKYEDKIRKQREELDRYKERVLQLEDQAAKQLCIPTSDEDTTRNTTYSTLPRPPPEQNYNGIPVIPILVMACDRKDYLQETLTHLFKYKPAHFPVVISQGCGNAEIANFLKNEYANKVVALQHYRKQGEAAYFAIAQHYGWALTQVFSVMNYEAVIIIEDDLEISSDFFEYFVALYPILRSDPSLYCVSSWNDNGMAENVRDPAAVYRNDVFPGLGWMMTKMLWDEIKGAWPDRYWDEYMREPEIRKERSCLFPEISRNKNIGERGTSDRQFWDKISRIKFNTEHVNFTSMDLSYLKKDKYDAELKRNLANAKQVSWTEVEKYENENLRIEYGTIDEYKSLARFFRLMEDEKRGMPRTSYKGVVQIYHKSNKLFITPENIDSRW